MRHSHVLGKVNGCTITRAGDLRQKMLEVAKRCAFNVRAQTFVQFEPEGATGVLVLAESHFSAHTFHEEGCVRVDVYCCSEAFNPLQCMQTIEDVFEAKKTCEWRLVSR